VLKEFFTEYVPLTGRTIEIANGQRIPIKGIGNASVALEGPDGTRQVQIAKALHVPEFSLNLLSIKGLYRNDKIYPRFENQDSLFFPDGTTHKFHSEPSYHYTVAPPSAASKSQKRKNGEEAMAAPQVTRGRLSAKQRMLDANLLHASLGHCGEEVIRGLPLLCSDAPEALKHAKLTNCTACNTGKCKRLHSTDCAPSPDEFGWFSYDVAGPLPPTVHDRYRYLIVFTSLHGRYRYGALMRSQEEIPSRTEEFLAHVATYGRVTRLHSDNHMSNVSSTMKDICRRHSIRMTTCCPHDPKGNGISERGFGTIFGKVRTMMVLGNRSGHLPVGFWGYAALAAIDAVNRTTPVNIKGVVKTPWEWLTGHRPQVGRFRPMFCRAYMKIPPPDLPRGHKIHPQGVECMNLGNAPSQPGYVLWVLGWGVVRVSSDVYFLEREFNGLSPTKPAIPEAPTREEEEAPLEVASEEEDGPADERGEEAAEPTIAQRLARARVPVDRWVPGAFAATCRGYSPRHRYFVPCTFVRL